MNSTGKMASQRSSGNASTDTAGQAKSLSNSAASEKSETGNVANQTISTASITQNTTIRFLKWLSHTVPTASDRLM